MKKRKQNLPRPAVHRMELWWAALPTVPGHVQRATSPRCPPMYTSGVTAFPAAVSPCASR